MEALILAGIFFATVWFIARYMKKTLKDGELCQTCHEGKGGCGSSKTACK